MGEMTDALDAGDARLAHRLRQLRLERRWSLDDLAVRSGVSRATLSRLENNEVSPTAAVLGRLCPAYGLTMSRLLAQVETTVALVTAKDQPVWTDPASGFRRQQVSPPSSDFDCELLKCELPPQAHLTYDAPPRQGLEHHLYLLAGALEVTIEGQHHKLSAGDCLRYRLYGASEFKTAKRGAQYLLVVR
jgi:transcriptional regulator with XRE-family HTH domain